MYDILKINLCGKRNLYFFIEECLDVHLGVADKFGLIKYLFDNDYICFLDLWRDSINYLIDYGYVSEPLRRAVIEFRENEKSALKAWTGR